MQALLQLHMQRFPVRIGTYFFSSDRPARADKVGKLLEPTDVFVRYGSFWNVPCNVGFRPLVQVLFWEYTALYDCLQKLLWRAEAPRVAGSLHS
jgi:hypothetical protein